MAITGSDFIVQAEKVLNADSEEISIRCSIKNSYYGAYHRVRSILSQPIVEYSGMGSHRSFIEYLGQEAYRYEKKIQRKTLRILSLRLGQLKSERHKADYELDLNLKTEHAEQQLDLAKKVINTCSDIEQSEVA